MLDGIQGLVLPQITLCPRESPCLLLLISNLEVSFEWAVILS